MIQYVAYTVIILVALVLQLLLTNGAFKHLTFHGTERCVLQKGVVGAEDLYIDKNGIAFISSDDRTLWMPNLQRDGFTSSQDVSKFLAAVPRENQGSIYAINLRNESTMPIKLQFQDFPFSLIPDFHPHGVTMSKVADLSYLYIVNHHRNGDCIIIARVLEKSWPPQLQYVGVIEDPFDHVYLRAGNDLDVLTPVIEYNPDKTIKSVLHTVFVSNWMGSKHGDAFKNLFEMLTRSAWGSVAICQYQERTDNDTQSRPQPFWVLGIEGLQMPNGVAILESQRRLFVASSLQESVLVYELPADITQVSPLTLIDTIPMQSCVDNIVVDQATGDLWIGSHPVPLQFMLHQSDPAVRRAPSQVFRVHWKGANASHTDSEKEEEKEAVGVRLAELEHPRYSVYEVLLHDGSLLSASSAAACDAASRSFLVGGVFDDGVLVCKY